MTGPIVSFEGNFAFLSNFSPSPLVFENITFATVEHAFAAAKTLDLSKRLEIAGLPTPGKAKRAGRTVQLRPDWDAIRIGIMRDLLHKKFAPGSAFAKELLATGDRELVEGNTWNDRFWGVCLRTRIGENHLGQLLMEIRSELRVGES